MSKSVAFIQMWVLKTPKESDYEVESVIQLSGTIVEDFYEEIYKEVVGVVGHGEFLVLAEVELEHYQTGNGWFEPEDWCTELVGVKIRDFEMLKEIK